MEWSKLLRVNSAIGRRIYQSQITELSAYYSNRLSYEEVEKLVERVSGQAIKRPEDWTNCEW